MLMGAMIQKDREDLLPRLAKVAHNSMMADTWDDLPVGGIERGVWLDVAVAIVNEIEVMAAENRAQELKPS